MRQEESLLGFSGKGFLAPKGEPWREMASIFLLVMTPVFVSAIQGPASGETKAKMPEQRNEGTWVCRGLVGLLNPPVQKPTLPLDFLLNKILHFQLL